MAELESISARKATLLNPTEDDETAQVLRRRLFARIDDAGAAAVVDAYRTLWTQHASALAPAAARPETVEAFRASYPLHPEVLETLTEKAATLSNFQRVRGMLRLLARTVGRLAQEIDAEHYRGLPPYTTYVARTVFLHTLAFLDRLKGITPEQLRYALIAPLVDVSFVDDARKRFVQESAFLDDRPGAPLRLLAEANLTQVIRRQEQQVDPGTVRDQLRDCIREIFQGTASAQFALVPFPGSAYEVPDEAGDGRPYLVLLGYDAVSVGGVVEQVPHLVERMFKHKGQDQAALRGNRNALVFVVADDGRRHEMRQRVARRLALQELKKPERLGELADHQQAKVRELEQRSETEVAVAIQQCYRHVFYPSRADRVNDAADLGHTAIDVPSTGANPGSGQLQVVRVLREMKKLRTAEDEPDSPAYTRDRTPLKKGEITTRALREESLVHLADRRSHAARMWKERERPSSDLPCLP